MPVTRVLRLRSENRREVAEEVARVLEWGGLAVLPTETVYGVAAKLSIERAVERVFVVKNRPREPLTVHFAKLEHVEDLVDDPEPLYRVWGRLWPGPVTLILRASSSTPRVATAGLPCVGLRAPAHPLTEEVLSIAGPCVMPSANLSGRPSPLTGFDALIEMFGRVEIAVDAGPCAEGLESTIVDLCRDPPRVLRLGPIGLSDIESVLGRPVEISERALGIGTRPRYRVSAPLLLVEGDPSSPSYHRAVAEIIERLSRSGKKVAILCRSSRASYYSQLGAIALPLGDNELDAARRLYENLRRAESLAVDIIVAESWGNRGLGLAITSRLRNAATEIVRV
ncbi:MAG: threonylcarbamoyl-AMP synthase [Crenarchaeota archaeon]|nr:threonylcarbamoyl-AMP synthase [Thermoproteota archaeon]